MTEEQAKFWFFTFGCGQQHAGKYVQIFGTYASARDLMVEEFGGKWSMQYDSAEEAGVEKWGYTLLEAK